MLIRLLVAAVGGMWKLKDKCNKTKFRPLKWLYIRLYSAWQFANGSSIAYNSRFDGEPCFPHGMHGIFVSGSAKIGRNCIIFQQVTIGSNTLPDSKRVGAPVIHDNCYIGAGAKIIGNVAIGNNVRIGANCVVYEDVPDNSVVVSSFQKTIQKDRIVNRVYSRNAHGHWMYYEDGRWSQENNAEVIGLLSARLPAS